MKIDEIIIKLCELDSRDEMEVILQDEIDRTEKLEETPELDNYRSDLYDVYGYLMRGKFRNFKPCYLQLEDKLKTVK